MRSKDYLLGSRSTRRNFSDHFARFSESSELKSKFTKYRGKSLFAWELLVSNQNTSHFYIGRVMVSTCVIFSLCVLINFGKKHRFCCGGEWAEARACLKLSNFFEEKLIKISQQISQWLLITSNFFVWNLPFAQFNLFPA